MPRKIKQEIHVPEGFNPVGHPFEGTVWHIEGSKGKTHEVKLDDRGFVCFCLGFTFHGKCRHVQQVVDGFQLEN